MKALLRLYEGAMKALLRLYQGTVKEELAMLALCRLFSSHSTRKSDILYNYSVVAFGLALSL
jgi:hypothetical protein